MKHKRFTEEQIIAVLKQSRSGSQSTREVCRQAGITPQTFYRWKAKYDGLEVSDAKKLRSLEQENSRLKKLVAEQALDIQVLKDINSRKW